MVCFSTKIQGCYGLLLMISIVSISLVVPISTNKTKWTILPRHCGMNSPKQKFERVKDNTRGEQNVIQWFLLDSTKITFALKVFEVKLGWLYRCK